VTTLVHGAEELEAAIGAAAILFGNSDAQQLAGIHPDTLLAALEGVPTFDISKAKLETGINILDFLATETGVFPSKGEARKMIAAGGFSLNKEKVASENRNVDAQDLLHDRFMLAQKGKKQYFLIRAV
jgi:tyrosyl-tRNA synthetase